MTDESPNSRSLSKNERREAAREKARLLREVQKKKDRRAKFLVQGGIIVVSLGIIAAVTLVILNGIRPAAPGPLNMLSDGIKIGEDFEAITTTALQPGRDPLPNERDPASEIIDIKIFVDYMCPICGAFEAENGDQIATLVESGAATIEIHPVAILDRFSVGTEYSTRAANAAACVANSSPDSFYDYNAALFEDQPEENTEGLSNEELFDRAVSVGVTDRNDIEECIDEGRFEDWVGDATGRARNGPIPFSNVEEFKGTPTIIVNGQQYNFSLPFGEDEFASFIIQATGTTLNDVSTPTATPTPEPTSTG